MDGIIMSGGLGGVTGAHETQEMALRLMNQQNGQEQANQAAVQAEVGKPAAAGPTATGHAVAGIGENLDSFV